MPVIDKISLRGTTYDINDTEARANKVDNSVIAPVETGSTASQAYAEGEFFIKGGAFCTATDDINIGDTLTENTNYTAGQLIDSLGGDLSNYVQKSETAGLIKNDGTIDTNTYLPSSNYKELSKKRYTITALNWSNEVDVNGYYTYTVTLSNPTLNITYAPAVYLTGADDSTFYTDTEYDMYSYLDQCNLTTASTLMLYATQKPDNNFYIFIEGKAN